MSGAYPTLLSPIAIGPLELRNRVAMSGMSVQLADGAVNERLIAYVAARAQGGVGLITLGSAPVHPDLHTYEQKQLALYADDVVPGLAQLAGAVHAAGARLSQILWHGGHNVPVRSGHAAVAPSPIPSVVHGNVPRAITRRELRELPGYYARAARRCREAGLDAVEIQTAADYLLGSFLSRTLNRRTDEYGGSLENRVRATAEVLEAVREAAGDDMAVAVRTSSAHLIPTDPDDYGLEESTAAMALLAERGLVDWVSVLAGSYWSAPAIVPAMTAPRAGAAEHAAAFKRAGLGVPIIVAGRIRTPEEAEDVLASGQADVVALGRTLLADPDWVRKAQAGRAARIRPCVSCNQACWASFAQGAPVSCIVNPAAGQELTLPPVQPAAAPRRVTVVGGGPAGMEAARVAAERGHQVTLHEEGDALGGQLAVASAAPHRGELGLAVDWWRRELDALGVDVRLGSRVETPPAEADAVVWAVGAEPGQTAVWRFRPALADGIPGTEDLPHGRAVMAGRATVAGRVLVIDEEGGWQAVSLCEELAARPEVTAVTVTTTAPALGHPDLLHTLEIFEVGPRVAAAGVTVRPETFVLAVADGSADLLGGERLGPFDAIVLSTGTVAPALADDDALAVGDCVAPRGIWAATNDAARVARRL